MTKKSKFEVGELLEMGMTPSEVLKEVAEDEIRENRENSAVRKIATKDMSAQTPDPQSKMTRPAIK